MGFVRQALHKSEARRDLYLEIEEGLEQMALTNLAELDSRRVVLAKQVGEAEKAEATAFARVEPKAAAELARRQERALSPVRCCRSDGSITLRASGPSESAATDGITGWNSNSQSAASRS